MFAFIGLERNVLADNPGDLSSIPRPHVMEGENWALLVILWPHSLATAHAYTLNESMFKFSF